MNTPHKYAALIKAWADGATVQVRSPNRPQWEDLGAPGRNSQPSWCNECGVEFRIKPANVVRYCAVRKESAPYGIGVTGCSSTHEDAAALPRGAAAGVLRLEFNPDTLELVSATMEKP